MNEKIALGLMSGTSIDGSVSAALLETDGDLYVRRLFATEYCYEDPTGLRPVHHLTKAAEGAYRKAKGDTPTASALYPEALSEYVASTFALRDAADIQAKIQQLAFAFFGNDAQLPTLADIVARSTSVHAAAAQRAIEQSGIARERIQYVGYHGQTLYHDPFVNRVTVQVGDPQRLTRELEIPVVFDFRSNDVRNGGQGAPLAPAYHRALLHSHSISSAAVLNLGGTANLTILNSSNDEMLGFDTGPANGLIDRYVKEKAGLALDKDSALALRGKVSQSALSSLLARSIILADGRNYLDIPPPKSLDIRDYTYDVPELQRLSIEDGCATLNAFTAECVALGLEWAKKRGVEIPSAWVLCGGGAKSPHMRAQLAERLAHRLGAPVEIKSADDVGWSAEGMEAELFAYLAIRSARGLPITFPGTTGVAAPLTGGTVFRAAS